MLITAVIVHIIMRGFMPVTHFTQCPLIVSQLNRSRIKKRGGASP